jgi:hypothetical protein
MKKIRSILPFLAIFIMTASAFSQSYISFQTEAAKVRETAKLRFGPIFFIPLLKIDNLGYDNNAYYRAKGESLVGDFMGTASLELKAYVLLGNSLMLSFTENPEYLHYFKESRLRSFTNSYSPAVRLNLLRRLTLSGDYHFRQHTRRALSEFYSLVTDTVKGYGASFFFETPRGSSLGLSAGEDRIRYEDIVLPDQSVLLSDNLNRKERTGNIEFYYRAFTESVFFIKAGATKYVFEHPSSSWRNAHSYQASTGIRFPLTGRAQGTLSVGYKKFVPETEFRKAFSGFIADSSLQFRFRKFVFRLGLGRDSQFSYLEDALYYIESKGDAGLSFYLLRFLRLDYDFHYGRLNYPEPFLFPGGAVHRIDTMETHSAGFTIKLFKTTGIGVRYNILDRTSNVPGFNLARTFIGISLIQGF